MTFDLIKVKLLPKSDLKVLMDKNEHTTLKNKYWLILISANKNIGNYAQGER